MEDYRHLFEAKPLMHCEETLCVILTEKNTHLLKMMKNVSAFLRKEKISNCGGEKRMETIVE